MRDLSVLIPARNEQFLRHTIEDVLAAIEADTEVICICDGALPIEPIEDHPRVKLVLLPKPIGQRAATNMAARLSTARYIMKLDSHCRVSKGFDVALIQDCEPDWMLIPKMFNLHVYDDQCRACGHRTYQGPLPTVCVKCGKSEGFERIMVWEPRWSRMTEAYRMDNELKFGYWRDVIKRPDIQAQGDVHDTMSFLGACQFMEREYFWKLGGCDLGHGGPAGWGQWATEWSLKVALSGGRVAVTRHAWFSHLFRSNSGGGFGFPFPISGVDQENARRYSRDLWMNNRWPGQRYPLSAWIERWYPIPGWTEQDLAQVKTSGVSFCLQSGKNLGPIPQVHRALPSLVANLTPPVPVDRLGQNVSISTGDLIPLVVPVLSGRQESSSPLLGTSPPLAIGLTDSADSTGISVRKITSRRQFVAPNAVSLSTVDRGDSVGPREIVEVGIEDQMGRVAAGRIIADDMVNLGNVCAVPEGNGTDQPSPHKTGEPERSVGQIQSLLDARKTDLAVAIPVSTAIPNPTSGNRIHCDVAENAGDFFDGEKRDDEILLSSHDSTSNVESGIGSELPDTRSGPSILTRTLTASIIYYSDCCLPDPLAEACQRQLRRAAGDIPIICVSLGKAIDFGDENVIMQGERGPKTLFLQILAGLERSTSEYVYLAEHDCLMPPQHFQFIPPRNDTFYYDTAMYRVSAVSGRAVTYQTKQLSGLCANRLLLIEHFYRRLAKMAQNVRETIARGEAPRKDGHDKSTGWEPGSPYRQKSRIDDYPSATYAASVPYLDIREHGSNWTKTRWDQSAFTDQRTCAEWKEVGPDEEIPGWPGKPFGRFDEWLAEITR